MRLLILFLFISFTGFCQTNTYSISFENAVHHEAKVTASFPNLEEEDLVIRMSRTSPGRYALHEFAKNVYGLKATNSKGENLEISRPDPHSWKISGHDGTVKVEYTLFANRGDGTYSQIDETHAHLNIPATFIFSEELQQRPIEVTFDTNAYPDWKVATQLKHLEGNRFSAPNLYYFMDSPTEISEYDLRQFELNGENVRFVLHHQGTEQELDQYFEQVKGIVTQQMKVFGELPDFDFGEYTFLACYMPQVSGDGMEHRNSTVLTSLRSLAKGGMKENISTVSHEFFHAWNVERIRPKSLEPFDFTEANMSGELWFAEGFTSYYTNLILSRAGIITPEDYVSGLNGTFNYVWNSPAREYFNPIEMSYQAPFVDAATSVDPVNRENTFISYYSYGSVLGLALDLKLREKDLNLDGYMALVWETFGKPENSYTIKDLEKSLGVYAGAEFASEFFSKYIFDSEMPPFEKLFQQVGLQITQNNQDPYFGPTLFFSGDAVMINSNPQKETPAYNAGLNMGDVILSINSGEIKTEDDWNKIWKTFKPNDTVAFTISRSDTKMEKKVKLGKNPQYLIEIDPKASEKAKMARKKWLSSK